MATMTADCPRRYRFTTDEYFKMAEAGVLPLDARVELIEGELIDMPPIGPPHAATVERLADLLRPAIADRAMVRTQQPSVVGRYSAPQPDISVVAKRGDYYEHAHPQPRDVLLVVEVAASTLAFDREVKAGVYARSGVPEVWIVDVAGRSVTRLHSPRDGAYAAVAFRVGESIAIGALPDVRIDVAAIFPS